MQNVVNILYLNVVNFAYLILVFLQFTAAFPAIFRRQSKFNKVINGFQTKEPLPYQLYLIAKFIGMGYAKTFECGATLITTKLALSAHHCFEEKHGYKLIGATLYGNLFDKSHIFSKKNGIQVRD